KDHGKPAQLDGHVREPRELADLFAPKRKPLFTLTLVSGESQRRSDMVENDGCLREVPGQIDQLGQLRLQQPCIERQVEFRELRKALAEIFLRIEPWADPNQGTQHIGICIIRSAVANPGESVTGGP